MWAFRRRRQDLSPQQSQGLDELFQQLPELKFVYEFRWGITELFDESRDREEASSRLEEYRELVNQYIADGHREEGEALLAFFRTYDAHRDGILAYFDERKTSGVVEGLNNKARVITKRCFGLKSVQTLWNRLCLDVNLACQTACSTIRRIKEITNLIRDKFLGLYT